ncbi:MAG: hypothetical protein ACR2ML_05105 [Solirubrobacteraceae bacterium]
MRAAATYDLRKGKRVASSAGMTPSDQSDASDPSTSIGSIVLRRNGAVAWIGAQDDGAKLRQVRRIGADRSFSVLDTGADIAPESLALSGSTLYWLKAGVPRTGMLG